MSKQQAQSTAAAVATQPEENAPAPTRPLRERIRLMRRTAPERKAVVDFLKRTRGQTLTAGEIGTLANLATEAMLSGGELEDLRISIIALERCGAAAADWPKLDQQWREVNAGLAILAEQIDQAATSADLRPLEAEQTKLLTERSRFAADYHTAKAARAQLEGLRADGIA